MLLEISIAVQMNTGNDIIKSLKSDVSLISDDILCWFQHLLNKWLETKLCILNYSGQRKAAAHKARLALWLFSWPSTCWSHLEICYRAAKFSSKHPPYKIESCRLTLTVLKLFHQPNTKSVCNPWLYNPSTKHFVVKNHHIIFIPPHFSHARSEKCK